jgi:hypothetical protein
MNTEKNKLIVEFMGIKPKMESPDVYTYSDMPFYSIREDNPEKVIEGICKYVQYSTDWNWLMEVVQKCYEIDFDYDNNYIGDITCELTNVDIGGTYEAVVNFIEWYNEQKQN